MLTVIISEFRQGERWIESAAGSVPCPDQPDASAILTGELRPVSGQTVWFDAHQRHCAAPWEGTRIVLAEFVVKGFHSLSEQNHAFLEDLGFALPGIGTGDLLCGTLMSVERPIQSASCACHF